MFIVFYLAGPVSGVRRKLGFLTCSDVESVAASVRTSNKVRSETLYRPVPPRAVTSNKGGPMKYEQ